MHVLTWAQLSDNFSGYQIVRGQGQTLTMGQGHQSNQSIIELEEVVSVIQHKLSGRVS